MTEDVTKWDAVLEWKAVKALNRLAYIKDKQKMIAQKNRQIMAGHGS